MTPASGGDGDGDGEEGRMKVSCWCSNCLKMKLPPLTSAEAERKALIESEPRTLKVDQLQYAREAALYVLSTRSVDEALSIFTKGLEPVLDVEGMDSDDDAEDLDPLPIWDNLDSPSMSDVASSPF